MYNRVISKKPIDYIFVQLFEQTIQLTVWLYIDGSRSLRVSTKTIFEKNLTRKNTIFPFFRSQSIKSIFDVFWGNRPLWVRKWPWKRSTVSRTLCGTPLIYETFSNSWDIGLEKYLIWRIWREFDTKCYFLGLIVAEFICTLFGSE